MVYAPPGTTDVELDLPESAGEDFLIPPTEVDDPVAAAKKALASLEAIKGRLENIDKAIRGDMDKPYVPPRAQEEYKLLAERSVTNMLLPALNAPAQSLFVDDHRLEGQQETSPAFAFWRRNRMNARQVDLHRDALTFGESYAAVEKPTAKAKDPKVRLLSRLRTAALWVDPANDDRPAFVLNVVRYPADKASGLARGWDATNYYTFDFTGDGDEVKFTVSSTTPHGFTDTPVIAYSPYRDLLGRTRGIIEPLLGPQKRLNQTVFELLVAQTYTSHQVRFITGMVPPPKRQMVDYTLGDAIEDGRIDPADEKFAGLPMTHVVGKRWTPVLDENGEPVPEPIQASPSRMFVIEDEKANVGALPQADLSGFLNHIAQALSDLATVAQIPPSAMTGSIANMAADALAVLEGNFTRMLGEFKTKFGESHEQLLALLAEAAGQVGEDDAWTSEVRWRDTSSRSLAQIVDAWGKAAALLDVPKRALWERLPGVSSGDRAVWEDMADQAVMDYQGGAGDNLTRSLNTDRSAVRDQASLAAV